VSMREELARLHAHVGTTTVYVTHDQVEAMTLGTQVAVMRDGVLQQCASADELYRRPVNLFCASFIGSPAINLADAVVADGVATFANIEVPLTGAAAQRSGPLVVGVRPSDLRPARDSDEVRFDATFELVENLGSHRNAVTCLDAAPARATCVRDVQPDSELLMQSNDRARWTVIFDDHLDVRVGERMTLSFDPRRIYVFDADTGVRLGD